MIKRFSAIVLSATVFFSHEADALKPFVISQGDEWIPIDYRRDIEPGSALDFSVMGFLDAPAGKHGWLKNVQGHFEFEGQPGVRQKFYGVNLVGTSNFPDHKLADALVERFVRFGYNSIRIHHHDRHVVEGSADGFTTNPENMDRLDYFAASAIRRGLYLTTDLYCSRPVTWRQIGVEDKDGFVDMQLYKVLCAVHEPAFENWKAYASAFLLHENAYTGRRYIDEPAMPMVALINEGSIFNAWDNGIRDDPRVVAAWRQWLSGKRKKDPSFAPGLDCENIPTKYYEPNRPVYPVLAQWAGDLERKLFSRMKAYVRSIGCKALLTNDNNGMHCAALQLASGEYDYVDDHVYVDHPSFPEKSWRLPSCCRNVNHLLGSGSISPGHKAYTRILGKPFTLTEWNFAAPGRFRGMGGLMVGALGAMQDWDGIWRFAYAHSREKIHNRDNREPSYFDLASDPLAQASERAAICLFLRGDVKPLAGGVALSLSPESPKGGRALDAAPNWGDASWNMRVGTCLSADVAKGMNLVRREEADSPKAKKLIEGLKKKTPLCFNRKRGAFSIDTPLTCGGFAPEGEISAGVLNASVSGAPATIWIHSLDGKPIRRSQRLLLSHLTDVQGDGATFEDETMRKLLKWGGSPLVKAGKAEISLSLDEPESCVVYELSTGGKRMRRISSRPAAGVLRFTASVSGPDGARILYEIVKNKTVGDGGARLLRGFDNPPKENRPVVWWWFDDSAPEAAVTRDLEGLARVGISGFHIYGGSATSRRWVGKVKWALHEAKRLGLDATIQIGPAGCGHPKTEPFYAQKDVVFTVRTGESPVIKLDLPKRGVKETPKNADGTPAYYWDVAVLAVPDLTEDVPVDAVRDVSRYLDRNTGSFLWTDAPRGKWRILRIGYVPKVFGWAGCYIDHMSREAFDVHWAHVMTPLLAELSSDERAALKGVMCDSWEAGTVSWTKTFPEEFRRRRGYDVLPWLPAKAGVKLGTVATRARFMRDFAETINELIAENHYLYQKKVANSHGLVSIAEAAGPHQHQGDVRRLQGKCDVAMGEFWMPSGHRPLPFQRFMVRDAANAAHVYGMKEVLAEAFTTINTYWIESPRTMKPCADRAFCDGLTRVCYHGMKLSSSLVDKPGAIRNVGTHYNPQTTWFEQSKAFNLYLSRCSWMLSQGRFSADCLVYAGDAINVFAGMKIPDDGIGEGYDYDFCPTELLLQARVEDGQIALPSGMRYRVLLLSDKSMQWNLNMMSGPMKNQKSFPPASLSLSEPAMCKLSELARNGAIIVGARPSGPVSMNESSKRYHAAADVLWGKSGLALPNRAEARNMLAAKGIGPDFSIEGGAIGIAPDGMSPAVDWIHRTCDDGTDIYFVSNQKDETVSMAALFRLPEGRSAVLMDPVTGERRKAGTSPRVMLTLPPFGSVFVVFGQVQEDLPGISKTGESCQVSGKWIVVFDRKWGGPAQPVEFTRLTDWTERNELGVKHYSGTAFYRTTFDAPRDWKEGKHLKLDLGDVREVAEVYVNGVSCGIVWTKPFAVVVKNAKATGNKLEVRVANLWPNRLALDASLPEKERLTRTNINPYNQSSALLPSGLLGPVVVTTVR